MVKAPEGYSKTRPSHSGSSLGGIACFFGKQLLLAAAVLGLAASIHAKPLAVSRGCVLSSFGKQTLGNPPVTLDERVWNLKFSPDGEKLFAIADSVYQIDWRKKFQQVGWQIGPHENVSLIRGSFSPDGSMFATLSQGSEVHLHETRTGKDLLTLEHRAAGWIAVAWSADQEFIAFGGPREILIHHARTGAIFRKIPQGETDIIALAFSPDGKLLVAGNKSYDKTKSGIFLHRLDRDAPPIPLPGDGDRSSDLLFSFSPDSTNLAVFCNVDNRETLYLWDLKEQKIIRQEASGSIGNAITHSPDGSLLAACGLNNLEIRDTLNGREVFRHQQEGINEHYWSVAFSPDGKRSLSASKTVSNSSIPTHGSKSMPTRTSPRPSPRLPFPPMAATSSPAV